MTSDESPVVVSIAAGVAMVTLNRPRLLNALDGAMADELMSAVASLSADESVLVVVLRGAGEAFMAGGDIGIFNQLVTGDRKRSGIEVAARPMIEQAQRIVLALCRMPKPVIASVHGACAGYGLSLMLASDIAVAADDTKFTLAYIHLGTTPDGGASYHLARVVGQKRAAAIALLGDRFGAADAERWGMVNQLVPSAELESVTAKLAARIAQGPALAYARTKKLLNESGGNTLEEQLRAETDAFADSLLTEDFAAGVSAFLAKKPPRFRGR